MNATKWIRLEPTANGIRATCLHCQGGRTFSTIAGDGIYLDQVVDAMTDHVLRNHADLVSVTP